MERSPWRRFDFALLGTALALIGYGLAMIYTSTSGYMAQASLWESPTLRQALFSLLGLVAGAVVIRIDYRFLGNMAPLIYGAALVGLALVFLRSDATYGARRWIDLGFFPLQPSEVAKLAVIIALAKYLSDHHQQAGRWRVLWLSGLLMAIPAMAVFLQPDLGSALVFIAIWLGMALFAGIRLSHLGALAAAALAVAPLVYFFLMRGYMRERLATFFDPWADPLGAGYNILQAEISVGSGGFWGKGFAQGTQSQLHFLRVQSTDFIFSVVGEELGFVGAMALFALFILLLWRGIRVAALARDDFGRLLAVGIVTLILAQVFINVAGNTRLLPLTGIPLPFISYGGSSLITMMSALAILESIVVRHRKIEF